MVSIKVPAWATSLSVFSRPIAFSRRWDTTISLWIAYRSGAGTLTARRRRAGAPSRRIVDQEIEEPKRLDGGPAESRYCGGLALVFVLRGVRHQELGAVPEGGGLSGVCLMRHLREAGIHLLEHVENRRQAVPDRHRHRVELSDVHVTRAEVGGGQANTQQAGVALERQGAD
nr:hypothetical protein [Azospirillum argentinense]